MGQNEDLILRLRRTATVIDAWDLQDNPPLTDWSALMDDAADALEALTEEES